MRFCFTILIGSLLLSVGAHSQTITELIMPRYIQGINSSADAARVPYIFRLKIEGLTGNATYRYFTKFVDATSSATVAGDGNLVTINPVTGEFKRIGSPSLGSTTVCGQFTTDPSGSFTGWFGNEAAATNMFTPGNELFIRLTLNPGNNTSQVLGRYDTRTPIKVINWGSTPAGGTALRSTAAAGGTAKNFVMLYDNVAGAGQPVTGTMMESDGMAATGLAPFYGADVDAKDKTWGTIIPNNLTTGIQKIVQYSFAGAEVASRVSSNGQWPTTGGTTVSTVAATGGANNVLVLDGDVVTLAPGTPIKLSQQINFNNLTATYGDIDFAAGGTATSGLAITYESSNTNVATIVNGNLIHIVGAGTVDITAKQAGDDNYTAATPVTSQLTINKADLTITAEDKLWLKGAAMPTLTLKYSGFKYNDNETVLNPQPQVSTSATPASNVGTYDIEVTGAGSPDYNIIYDWGNIEVIANKQNQTITFNALANKKYGDADFSPGATTTSPLTVTYTSSNPAVATVINSTTIRIIAPGKTTITAKQGGDVSYEPATDVNQDLIVEKAPLRITADNKTRLFGRDNPDLTIVYSGFVKNENAQDLLTQPQISTTADRSSLPGEYIIKVEGATSDNYDITYENGKLTVDALPAQVITFDALPLKKYGDGDFKPNAQASSGLPVSFSSSNPAVATIIGDAVHITGAGATEITATQAGNASNAPATPVVRTLTVQKTRLTIKADNISRNEGEENPAFTVTYSGFVNNEDAGALSAAPTVNTTATAQSVAGSYNLNIQGAASNNYTIQYQKGTLTILPAQGEGQDNVSAYISAPGQLQVNTFVVSDVKTAVQLFDLNGTRLVNTTVSMKKGSNTFRLAIGNIAPGIYNLRVAGNGVMLKTKVVIR